MGTIQGIWTSKSFDRVEEGSQKPQETYIDLSPLNSAILQNSLNGFFFGGLNKEDRYTMMTFACDGSRVTW